MVVTNCDIADRSVLCSSVVYTPPFQQGDMAVPFSRCLCRYSLHHVKEGNVHNMRPLHLQISPLLSCFYDKDPAPLSFNPKVQQLLRRMNRVDINKVFRKRKDGQKLRTPDYKFMTTEELNECFKEAEKKVEARLQIPPIVKVQDEINEILSEDRAITGHDDSNFVFTDITYGVKDRERLIIVREPNGVLRKAIWSERYRVNQIYFPVPDREMRMPHMFEEQHLMNLLEREEYEFILDRACIQFEPDDPDYQRVTSTTYDYIEKGQKFDALQSTRHFGALVFYLAWHKHIDTLVLHNLQNDRIEDTVSLIKLLHILHPDCKSASVKYEEDLQFIKAYIDMDSVRKSVLELALQTYKELLKQREMVEEGVKRAHGL